MTPCSLKYVFKQTRKAISISILVCFISTSVANPAYSQVVSSQTYRLPAPGAMVRLSPPLNPPMLKGIKVHPDNPFRFDFILDKGDSQLSNDQIKDESSKLIKYFLASVTIPEKICGLIFRHMRKTELSLMASGLLKWVEIYWLKITCSSKLQQV